MPITEEKIKADSVYHTDRFVMVNAGELRELLNENARLSKQVDELQASQTRLVENRLARQVRAFHAKFGHPIRTTPAVPSDEEVRFRLRLIGEEFVELLDACFDQGQPGSAGEVWRKLVETMKLDVKLPDVYDALLDLAYVIEGTHCAFGTNSELGMLEVQRANMAKDPVYVAAKDATHRAPDPMKKPTKPSDWKPPDMVAVLEAQGWPWGLREPSPGRVHIEKADSSEIELEMHVEEEA